MADDDKRSYPSIPARNWWALRKKFKGTIPAKVTASFLAPVLSMTATSARNNILPSLKIAGLIDNDGKPTDRVVKWRDDTQYPEVCDMIRNEVYPQELLDLAPDSSVDKNIVQSWFSNHTGLGASSVGKISSFYMLLCEADPSKGVDVTLTAPAKDKSGTIRTLPAKPSTKGNSAISPNPTPTKSVEKAVTPYRFEPAININIQIHISPDAPPHQIDEIFASMSKHLKELRAE